MESLGILVCNRKGGVGKTTIATNLAASFSKRDWKTVLIDCDPQQSSLEWHSTRDEGGDLVCVPGHSNQGIVAPSLRFKIPVGTECLIYDAPACTRGFDLGDLARRVQLALVPVMPSPIDAAASETFIQQLLRTEPARSGRMKIAVVANRINARQRSTAALQKRLAQWNIPVVGGLRDTQLYVYASGVGRGIHELKAKRADRERAAWRYLYAQVLKMTGATKPERTNVTRLLRQASSQDEPPRGLAAISHAIAMRHRTGT